MGTIIKVAIKTINVERSGFPRQLVNLFPTLCLESGHADCGIQCQFAIAHYLLVELLLQAITRSIVIR